MSTKQLPSLMRDVVINRIFDAAKNDKDILFISADLGAAALDNFREKLPDQFIHAGISEQNMVDLASGLALSGKKVFLYAMAPFLTARCYEQIKCVISSMNLPITLIAVGVGLGYDHATLTHFTPEDIACMRALNGIEIVTPGDSEAAKKVADVAIMDPGFRYIRLDRQGLEPAYHGGFKAIYDRGLGHIEEGKDVVIITCGVLLKKALVAREILGEKGLNVGVIDLFRIKPINGKVLADILSDYGAIVTVEEQSLEGGMGSAVLEVAADHNILKPVRRLGMRDGYAVINGDRDSLHELYGIDTPHIVDAAMELWKGFNPCL
jgi:transketolase